MERHQLQQIIGDINFEIRNRLLFGWLAQFGIGLTGLALMAFGLPIARSEFEIGGYMTTFGGVAVLASLAPKLTVSMIPGMNRRSRWTRLLSIVACAVVGAYWLFFNLLNLIPETPQVIGLGVLIGIALIAEIGYLARELSDYFR